MAEKLKAMALTSFTLWVPEDSNHSVSLLAGTRRLRSAKIFFCHELKRGECNQGLPLSTSAQVRGVAPNPAFAGSDQSQIPFQESV